MVYGEWNKSPGQSSGLKQRKNWGQGQEAHSPRQNDLLGHYRRTRSLPASLMQFAEVPLLAKTAAPGQIIAFNGLSCFAEVFRIQGDFRSRTRLVSSCLQC